MKDFLGRPLKVGQRVIIERTTYKGLVEGTVLRLTPKGATVSHRVPDLRAVVFTETNRASSSIYGLPDDCVSEQAFRNSRLALRDELNGGGQ